MSISDNPSQFRLGFAQSGRTSPTYIYLMSSPSFGLLGAGSGNVETGHTRISIHKFLFTRLHMFSDSYETE